VMKYFVILRIFEQVALALKMFKPGGRPPSATSTAYALGVAVAAPQMGLPDAFCKNTGHFDLSTVPDLSCVVIRKRLRENRATISIVKTQLTICLYFGWLITFLCVRDAKIAPRVASIAANKLR